MKYKIIYDKRTRLRIKAGKFAFTEKKGYGLAAQLEKYDFIKQVKTAHKNGGVLIHYTEEKYHDQILETLKQINLNEIQEAEPSPKNLEYEQENKFFLKIAKTIVKHYAIKFLVPIPIKTIMSITRTIPYLWRAIDSLTSFKFDVNLLDGTALFFSMKQKNFKSAASMMFLLSISDLLEEYTIQKTKNALKDSLALNVDTVWLVTTDEKGNTQETSYPLKDVKKGDHIKIRKGSVIPIDGKVIQGEAMVNEASMTGEPYAVEKKTGKTVHAGTVIEDGTLTIETLSVNDETRLNKIIQMIEESEDLKAGIQSKAEKLADGLVPYTLLGTAIVYALTRNITKAMSVLMVDFSCAIKLTTPISVISAMKEASDNRMMIKGGKHLEAYAKADTIVFDKTGTLTNASPKLEKVIPMGKYTREEVLKISACIEEHFAHSVATAIVKQAEKENIKHEEDHSEVEYIVAHGIVTQYHGKRAVIGSKHFILEDEQVPINKKQEKIIQKNIDKYSVIYLAIDGKLEGILCITDPVRPEAHKIISKLKTQGIENIIMLTGDSENAAKTIAQNLGITEYKSQVLPEDKAEIINKLKQEGHQVIMVGDGINDSPALSTANVSVAMRNSSDIAKEVADITLLSDQLNDLVTLRYLSTGMLDKINDNYHKILEINGSLILLGILGIITPSTSSTIHNLSTMLLGARSTKSALPKEYQQEEALL